MLKPGIPRHEQISNWIRSRIEQGEWGSDEKLPSESQLEKQFDVSRITVRRALQTLENEHLIYRRQGLGSFVYGERIQQGLVRLTDFVEDMQAAGLAASSRIIGFERVILPNSIAETLAIDEGEGMRLDRIRLADGQPIAFDQTWMPVFYAQLLRGHDLESDSIYRILETQYEIPVISGKYRIEAIDAPAHIADILQVPSGKALLLISRISTTLANRPLYFQKRFYRSDRVAYELALSRDPNAPGSSDAMRLRDFEPVFQDSPKARE